MRFFCNLFFNKVIPEQDKGLKEKQFRLFYNNRTLFKAGKNILLKNNNIFELKI